MWVVNEFKYLSHHHGNISLCVGERTDLTNYKLHFCIHCITLSPIIQFIASKLLCTGLALHRSLDAVKLDLTKTGGASSRVLKEKKCFLLPAGMKYNR
jgi:hypothetical protein